MLLSSGTFQNVIASYKVKGKGIQENMVTEFQLSNIPMIQSLPNNLQLTDFQLAESVITQSLVTESLVTESLVT